MTILFLDDDLTRQKRFRSICPYADIVTTAVECIEAMKKNAYDIVCLDHDLGGKIMVSEESENTGSEVSKWIVVNNPKIGKIIIHSFNFDAAKNMQARLKDLYKVQVVPYSILIKDFEMGNFTNEENLWK
jgi:CheY-like chemotaxis protein